MPNIAQAKQGNAKAIATLLNQKLQSKGITAKTAIKNSCLHIMLEAAKTPPQKPLVDFIRKGLAGLTVDDWCTVKVYGQRVGEEIPDWMEEFKTKRETKQDPAILAKQGDVKAVATLINQKLQVSGVVAKVSTKNDCLQIMLEAAEVPNQEQMVALLESEFQELGVQGINRLRLYGKQSGEDFPDWQEEIKLFVDKIESQEVQPASLDLSPSSKITQQVTTLSVVQEVDGVGLSNQIYAAIQTVCYQHLAYKVGSESDKTIHEIVEHFVNELETDLKLDLDQFAKQVIGISEPFGLQLEQTKIQSIISNVIDSNFTGVKLAIRDLERVTQEVLQTDFPQETNILKAFFAGAAQEFTANLSGKTLMSQEAMIGTVIGTLIAPGLGSMIGGAIGGWFGGNKQQKALEALIEKYDKARVKLFQEWETVLQFIYTNLIDSFSKTASVRFLDYQAMDQAIDFYDQGNEHLEKDLPKAIEFYDKAIQANPGLVLAWNNKGYALNQLEKFEEAIPVLVEAIKLDRTLVIALNNFGDSLQGLGKYEEAIATYKESLKLEPENYSSWYGIGTSLYNLQQFEKGIEVADKLIQLDPKNYFYWYIKAVCQSLMGYTQPALETLKEAVTFNPEETQKLAKTNPDFDGLREDEQFKELMRSSVGVSYKNLKNLLENKEWMKADKETARLMKMVVKKVANLQEEKITQETLEVFPCTDLETIDALWQENSEGKFSFSVQKRIFQESFEDRDIFGTKIGWRVKNTDGNWIWCSNADFSYNPEKIPDGHLPSSLWAGEDG